MQPINSVTASALSAFMHVSFAVDARVMNNPANTTAMTVAAMHAVVMRSGIELNHEYSGKHHNGENTYHKTDGDPIRHRYAIRPLGAHVA